MKKLSTLFTLSIILLTFAAVQINAQNWMVYDGSILPEATAGVGGDSLDISDFADESPGAGMVKEIVDDDIIAGNKYFKYLQPDGKLTFRYNFDDAYADTTFTIMARIKAENDSIYDRAFDIRWDNGNTDSRDELRIWAKDSTIELEKAGVEFKVDMDLTQWHTYRIVVNGDMSKIYIDENPVAVVEGVSESSSSNKYIKVGDGSGDAIGGSLDWLILNVTGSYGPEDAGADIPAELFVDGKSTTETPDWLVYDGSIQPEETEELGGDNLDISNFADDSPGAGMVKEIVNDDLIAGNKYFKYLQPDGKLTFRHYFEDDYADTTFTIMARIKAENDPTYDRAFDIRWDNGNTDSRDELRIWAQDSTIELEKADVELKVYMDLTTWHTYRIVVDGDMSYVYIDENPIAVVEGLSTSGSSNKYIKVGDGSGDAIGGSLDWLILGKKGAYHPGEGPTVPEELYVDGTPLPEIPKWLVYDGSLQPEATEDVGGDSLDISNLADNSPGAGMVKEIIDDEMIPGNKVFKYLQPDGKLTFRHYFADEYADSSFTIMARIKAENNAAYDRAIDIRWDNANAGTRDELRISAADSTLELEKAGVSIPLDVNFYEWHTYRIVIDGDNAKVYLDENPEPVLDGMTTASTTNKYFKVGDGSGDAIGGYLDWLIIDKSGAYAPGDGLPVPEGLKVDTGPEPVVPKWYVYDGSLQPEATEGVGEDSLDISNFADNSPGAGMVKEIIDDDMIDGNKVFKYLQPDGKLMFRHYFSDEYSDTAFTIMARIKAENDPTYDRAFDIRWDNGNADSRDELRIWAKDSTIELEKASVELKVDMDLTAWHTYRIVVDGDMSTVYVDENPIAVIEGLTETTSSNKYMKVGDGSGDAIGGYLDWLIIDKSGAYAPGEEPVPIPDYLFVDTYLEPIVPMWLVYDANVLPTETEGFGHDSLDISSLSSDSPGPGFVEELLADPGIDGNSILQYLMPIGNRMYRYYFPENFSSGTFTWMVRTRQEFDADTTYERNLDFQWRNSDGGARDELRIDAWDKTLALEKSDVEVPVEMDLFSWHTFRIAVNGAETKVYVDENPVPIISGTATEGTSDRYFKFGDAGSGVNGGYIDWMAIDLSGAYAPGEEPVALPEGLYVDFTTGIDDKDLGLPTEFGLSQNYPNPFNPSTTIKFQLPKASSVKLTIYNILGQMITRLVDEELDAGYHSVQFNVPRVSSGVYFYTIEAGDFVDVKKMLLLK